MVAHVAVPRGVNDPRLISFSSAMLTLRLRQVEGVEQVLHPPLPTPPDPPPGAGGCKGVARNCNDVHLTALTGGS